MYTIDCPESSETDTEDTAQPELGPLLYAHMRRLRKHMSQDETRYNISGICVEYRGEEILGLIATDGHRMLHVQIADDVKALPTRSVIIGAAELDVIEAFSRMDYGRGMPVTVSPCGGVITLRLNSTCGATLAACDGRFPDWRQVVPSENGNDRVHGTYSRKDLAKRVLAATEKHMRIADGTGPALNPKYLRDAIACFPAKDFKALTITFGRDLDPVVVTAEGSPLKVLIMPMRL